MNTSCSMALLESALAGDLPAGDEQALCHHLDACDACSAALESLAAGPEFCRQMAAHLIEDDLDAAFPPPGAWSEIDFTVEHLEAAEEPGVLGRLGDYDVLAVIGRGGMGVVLKAYDRQLKRCVAIKLLAPHLAPSSLARQRFAREAQAAAAVVHPNVMAIHHVQSGGRLPFLVMPLVAGESLAERLKAQGTLEVKEILRIGMQAAAGLAAAHEQGLVHRDVKPANILLEKGVERAVLTDFGLARAADDVSLTRYGIIAGTPEYMSPEQARGEPLDGRSDLFSLGCVLYEMATGVSPFRTDSVIATLRRLIEQQPRAIELLNPELPPWLVAIINRLLEKDPARRFSSAHELSNLLERCLAHVQHPAAVPLPAALVSPTSRSSRFSHLRQIGVLAMLAAICLAVLGLFMWQGPQTPETQPAGNNPAVAQAAPKQIRQFTIDDEVEQIALSPDGKLIAVSNGHAHLPVSVESQRKVQILDADSGKPVVSLKLRTAEEDALIASIEKLTSFEVGPFAFSPDGGLLAVATGLGQLKLFNATTGALLLSLDDEKGKLAEKETPDKLKSLPRAMGGVGAIAFSPDGTLLATCGGSFEDFAQGWDGISRTRLPATGPGRLKVWDVKTGALKHDLAGHSQAFAVAFSADGSLLASTGRWDGGSDHGNGVLVWNPQTGEKLRTILLDANGGTHAIAFSPTKKLIAVGSLNFDKENDTRSTSLSLIYPLSGITEWQRTISGPAMPRAFLPDGSAVLAQYDRKSLHLYETETGQLRRELRAADSPPAGRWQDVSLALQVNRIAIGGTDADQKGMVTVWDLSGGP